MTCSGASQSGKTMHVWNLLRERRNLFTTEPDFVIYFYNEDQPIFNAMRQDYLEPGHKPLVDLWIKALPTTEGLREKLSPYTNRNGSLAIVDDFVSELTEDIAKLFTV